MKMTKALAALFTAVLAACLSDAPAGPDKGAEQGELAPLYLAAPGQGIPGRYLVILKPDVVASASGVAARVRVEPAREFRSVRRGFVARLEPSQVEELRRQASVAWVEQDQIVAATRTQVITGANRPWGLDRIDQSDLPYDESYTYGRAGGNVTAYILDTGLKYGHSEFGGRAAVVFDAFGGDGRDCNGHGTHVAGIVGSYTYGVAKAVQLRGIRVLDCDGFGTTSSVVDGLDWLMQNAVAPAVANLSLAGSFSKTMNTWVDSLWNAGVFMVAAAGNDDDYTCTASPASALGVLTVAASDSTDHRATFSNWGRCADLYAPGVAIPSTWWPGNSYAIASGTSQAAPHAAGVAVLMKSRFGDLPSAEIERRILLRAVGGRIIGNDATFYQYGTPNILLQKGGL